ncbi:MAG: hypothetical protein PVF45_03575 [Anaerolineae bacterium]|jgi:hypothetical protein
MIREHPAWERLRQSWLALSALKNVSLGSDSKKVWATVGEQEVAHQVALDELVESGELDGTVAGQIWVVFTEVVCHFKDSMNQLCYIAIPFESGVRTDLLQQADALGQVAGELDLDPALVERAQAAIARDMAFFQTMERAQAAIAARDLSFLQAVEAGQAERAQIQQQYRANQLQASPEALEAARVLADLLLGKAK